MTFFVRLKHLNRIAILLVLLISFFATHAQVRLKDPMDNLKNMRDLYLQWLGKQKFDEGEVSKTKSVDLSTTNSNLTGDQSIIVKYRRSSLYTLMLSDSTIQYYKYFKFGFGNAIMPEKYNDHNLGPYLIPVTNSNNDRLEQAKNFLNANDVAKNLVAKWFTRNKNGAFSTFLVAQRGEYDASAIDESIATKLARGKALLKDAGEELIANTFVAVFDFNSKQIQAKGKNSYIITAQVYLFRLVWDDETEGTFYNNYWTDKLNIDTEKVKAFDNSSIFKLKYLGNLLVEDFEETYNENEIQYKVMTTAIPRVMEICMIKLQQSFEEFRVKYPLLSGNPISAKIGVKEGIKAGDKFEVLEKIINENGATQYLRLGIVTVNKNSIWDNSALGDWLESTKKNEFTIFDGPKGKYKQGMFIRQIYTR